MKTPGKHIYHYQVVGVRNRLLDKIAVKFRAKSRKRADSMASQCAWLLDPEAIPKFLKCI